jgi:hypothetical protein
VSRRIWADDLRRLGGEERRSRRSIRRSKRGRCTAANLDRVEVSPFSTYCPGSPWWPHPIRAQIRTNGQVDLPAPLD